jgi:hypothetical protein
MVAASDRAVLDALDAAGAKVIVRGGRLTTVAPPGVITPALAAAIGKHKSAIIHQVRLESPCNRCGSMEFLDVRSTTADQFDAIAGSAVIHAAFRFGIPTTPLRLMADGIPPTERRKGHDYQAPNTISHGPAP